MQSQRRARPRRPCVTHVVCKQNSGGPAGRQVISKAVEGPSNLRAGWRAGPQASKHGTASGQSRSSGGPQCGQSSGGPAGRPSSAMQQQAASLAVDTVEGPMQVTQVSQCCLMGQYLSTMLLVEGRPADDASTDDDSHDSQAQSCTVKNFACGAIE